MTRNSRSIRCRQALTPLSVVAALVVLAALATLAGCSMPAAIGHTEPTATHERRLDAATWPTPIPTAAPITPTPFPRVTLAPPTVTPTTRPAVLPDGAETSPMGAAPSSGERLVFTGNPQALLEQVVALSGGFTPAGVAMVTPDTVAVRQGPGESFAVVGPAGRGEMVAVLGKNAAGDWRYVLTQSVVQGWLPAGALQPTFSLGEPPVLADSPQPPAEVAPEAEVGLSQLLSNLAPVASALVTAEGISARQGPGDNYPAAAEVGQGELLGVFGTNAGGDWLYIVTISGTLGWVPRDAVRVMGTLEGAPVLPANPLAPRAVPAAVPSKPEAPQAAAAVEPAAVSAMAVVAAATVNADQLNMRQGAGPNYAIVRTVSRGQAVSVVAVNRARDWALVITEDGVSGWVYAEYLTVAGSLAEAPVVPATVLAAAAPAATVAAPPPAQPAAAPTVPAARVPAPSPLAVALAGLSPLAAAEPAGEEAILYRGPATTYEPIVTLRRGDSAAVLASARNASGWLLLQPAADGSAPGWAPAKDLAMTGDVGAAPPVTTAWVKSNAVPTRSGPGIAYDRNGVLAINALVSVVGVDRSRGWALVVPLGGGGAGWAPLNFLLLSGNWTDLPELPADILAQSAPPAPTAPPAGVTRASGTVNRLAIQLASGGDIVVIKADGSDLRRLTHGIDPALSHDGLRVAFTRWNGADGSLWVINVDGSGERLVLGETRQAKHPAWSPDDSRLVINFQHGGRLEETDQCKNLIELGDRRPSIPWNVNPDSIKVKIRGRIPYLCWTLPPDPHWSLRVVNLTDGGWQDMPSDTYAFAPEWDPANPWRIVSSGVNGLVQLDADRQMQWALSDRFGDRTPAFSPDGRYIAVAHNQSGSYDIHRLNADGSGRVRLTQTPLWVTAAASGNRAWNNVAPAWSPDGSRIAFLTDRTGRWEIWVMNADGSDPQPMFSTAVNDQLPIRYDFVDERVFTWR
jgi:TolB protein